MPRAVLLAVVLFTIAPVFAAHAGQTAAAAQPAGQKPKPPAETPGADAAPTPPPQLRGASQLANIRVELTITDQRGATPTPPKTVSMLVSDRSNGRIRTTGHARIGTSVQPIMLNVDAHPEILRDGRIRLQVSLEYRAHNTEGGTQEDIQPAQLSESFNVILEDGKPVPVTQSADPASDRKVRVDLKATLLK